MRLTPEDTEEVWVPVKFPEGLIDRGPQTWPADVHYKYESWMVKAAQELVMEGALLNMLEGLYYGDRIVVTDHGDHTRELHI